MSRHQMIKDVMCVWDKVQWDVLISGMIRERSGLRGQRSTGNTHKVMRFGALPEIRPVSAGNVRQGAAAAARSDS